MSVDHHVSASTKTMPPWRVPAVLGAATVGVTLLIARWGPSDHGTPICGSQILFGVDCPLCGGTRAVYALTQGDVLAAADQNLVATIALPILAILWAVWMFNSVSERKISLPSIPRPLWIALGIAVFAFGLLRNLSSPMWAAWLGSGIYVA